MINLCIKCNQDVAEEGYTACTACLDKISRIKLTPCDEELKKIIKQARRNFRPYSATRDAAIMINAAWHPSVEKLTTRIKRVPAHILLMERKLNRFLWPNERVVHKNGELSDNRLVNLKIEEILSPGLKLSFKYMNAFYTKEMRLRYEILVKVCEKVFRTKKNNKWIKEWDAVDKMLQKCYNKENNFNKRV